MGQSVLDATIQRKIRQDGVDRMDGDQELVDHIATCLGCAMAFCDEHTHIERTIEEMSDTDPPQFVKEACQSTY
jgi:TorA maturation chaperone TorD